MRRSFFSLGCGPAGSSSSGRLLPSVSAPSRRWDRGHVRRIWLLHGRPAIIKRASAVVLVCVKVAAGVEGGSLLDRRILGFPTNRIHSIGTFVAFLCCRTGVFFNLPA